MKLSIIVLYAVISPFLVSGDVTTDCEEWCYAKDKDGKKPKCLENCENFRTECLELCGSTISTSEDFPDEKNNICKKNCECIKKARRAKKLTNKAAKTKKVKKQRKIWEEVVRMLSHEDSGHICDDSKDWRF
mmetsp:Transcript_23482/g.46756  ORF Transcript_23482/g.46756 Transcript_23482/m.46756 type:complete len:132 (+) Transcript_23482:65-460(+)